MGKKAPKKPAYPTLVFAQEGIRRRSLEDKTGALYTPESGLSTSPIRIAVEKLDKTLVAFTPPHRLNTATPEAVFNAIDTSDVKIMARRLHKTEMKIAIALLVTLVLGLGALLFLFWNVSRDTVANQQNVTTPYDVKPGGQ